MAQVRKGDLIKSNDPRYGWVTEILAMTDGYDGKRYAIIKPRPGGRFCRVNLERIFDDGQPRAQGYNVVNSLGGGFVAKGTDGVTHVVQRPHPVQAAGGYELTDEMLDK